MASRDGSNEMHVEVRTSQYDLRPAERERLEADLHLLREVTAVFPVSALHLDIHRHLATHDFHVKASLRLPHRTLFTGERGDKLHPTYTRCLRKLVKKTKAYRAKMDRRAEFEKRVPGRVIEVGSDEEPDLAAAGEAVRDGDYAAFRSVLHGYHDSLEKRIGRWLQRDAQAQALVGDAFTISDVAEEVYLTAFEGFLDRPADRFGNYLEGLIDPAIRMFMDDPEKARIEVEAAREGIVEPGPDSSTG